MYSRKTQLVFKFLLAFLVLLLFSARWVKPASAEACTWQGDNGDWATPSNWSCGRVPLIEDDVFIDSVGMGPQLIYPSTILAGVNSISIGADSILTVNGGDYGITITTNSNFTNEGEIIITGDNNYGTGLSISSPAFSNSGTVTINSGGLGLQRGGTHSGDFVGSERTYLGIGRTSWPGETFTFTADSQIQVPIIIVNGDPVVNIAGDFTPGLVSLTPNESYLSIFGGTFNLTTTSVFLPYKVSTSNATLNLPITPLDVFELFVIGMLYNPAHLEIMEKLQLSSFTLTGAGDIEVDSQASTFTLRGGTISSKTLSSPITTNWLSGNITLADGAVFLNSGTFNAKATTTMTGTTAEGFINNGNFIKNTAGTTTTMDIPFTNNGTVDVIAGSLIFQKGMDNGENAVIDLGGGTLDPGDTLNLASGDSLIGSGTLAANLVNAGTVSPGNSAGGITIEGNYTQESTGVLDIQLGGTTAGTQYDQLTVTGTATMAGTLNVSLIDGFIPQVGDSFTILPYSTRSGGFSTLNVPEGYRWGFQYAYSGVILTVLEGGSISGTVTCNSPHTVFVDLWVDDYDSPPPQDSINITCGESYSFTNLPDGTYYVGAWIDLDESGDGPPDEGEPYAWYGDPTHLSIIDGEVRENIDISFPTGSISGTITCNSTHPVFVDIWAGNTEPPPYRSITINCGDSYSFTDLPDGTYYVDAWIDLNESGGGEGPDDGEPSAWYGSPTAVEITGGNSQSGIDITFPSANTGAIEGTVTCDSTHPVFVDIWAGNTEPPPEYSTTIACGDPYSFTELPDGTYYVGAWIDLDESGGGPPGDDETIIWYDDQTAVTITGGETKSGIDITFPSANTGAIEGTVTCDSTHPVFVDLWTSTTNPEPELSTTIACGETYSFNELPDGTYYVGAWIDLDESGGGPPDLGEPYVWYGDQTPVIITDGNTQSGIDITFPAESFQLFLPMIVK